MIITKSLSDRMDTNSKDALKKKAHTIFNEREAFRKEAAAMSREELETFYIQTKYRDLLIETFHNPNLWR